MNQTLNPSLWLALFAFMGHPVLASEAHVHGVASLQVAVDGSSLRLNLSSPLDNLLGFEHAPQTAAEKAAATQLTERLRKPETLFVLTPAAGCAPASTKIDAPVLEGKPVPATAKELDKAPAAAKKNSKAKGNAAHDDNDAHAELSAEYVFRCQRPDSLRGLQTKLFDSFRGLRQLNVQVAGPKGQSATKLTPTNRTASW